ncbi:MAG: 30S ribosomal protein S6 [Vampirovibrio sp.]|nr:30S ribosomal protein S6 [Vampirovibrio sp.]
MNTYEALVIFKPMVDTDNLDGQFKNFEKMVEKANGSVTKVTKIGRKRLPFEISKFKDGFFSSFVLKLPSEGIAALRKTCALSDEVLRITIIRVTEEELKLMAEATPHHAPVRPGGGGGRGRR